MKQVVFYLQNLKCSGCEKSITKLLDSIQGLISYDLTVEESKLVLHVQNTSVSEVIKVELASLGYPVMGDKNTLNQKAKSYVSCAIGKVTK